MFNKNLNNFIDNINFILDFCKWVQQTKTFLKFLNYEMVRT